VALVGGSLLSGLLMQSVETEQAALSIRRTRDLLVKLRTQLINMIRGLLAAFGVDIPKGLERALLMARQIVNGKAPDVPIEAAKIVGALSQQALDAHVRCRSHSPLGHDR
jgi:transposase